MKTCIVTGAAGFIAHTLVGKLLDRGYRVLGLDNLCRGQLNFIEGFTANPHFAFRILECTDAEAMIAATREVVGDVVIDSIWHLAANSDIGAGNADLDVDLRDTFLTTMGVLKLAKATKAQRLSFASTSAIYGDHGTKALAEDSGPLLPISNYGAMKLASEAAISSSLEHFLPRADIFRFPNVVGPPATHGVIPDLIKKLQADPRQLPVLGDGSQQKPYLHVAELVEAMLFIFDRAEDRLNTFNIGPDDSGCPVTFIAETVRDRVSPKAEIAYGREPRGWTGDVPQVRYDVGKLTRFGWAAQMNSKDAIVRAVAEIADQLGAR